MNLSAIASLLIGFSLAAAEMPPETGSLSSNHAAYDGNALILTGHVLLDHGLGQMQAEKASLQKQEVGSDFPFSFIELRKDVVLHLKSKGTLSCARADLDFSELKGKLYSEENGAITFSDMIKKNIPVKLISGNAELELSKNKESDKKNTYSVDAILAQDKVIIEYANAFILHADKALYNNKQQGTIAASSTDPATPCTLTHENDLILAETIDLDLPQGAIAMQQTEGVLASSLFPRLKTGAIKFKSGHLLWESSKNSFTLTGNCHVEEENAGSITAEEKLHFAYIQKEGKKFIKTISTKGKAVLHYDTHQLTCYGPIHLDREQLNVTVASPTTNGATPPDKQICYEEGEVKIFGDKALMEYTLFNDLLHPVSVALKDNVRLFSQNAATLHKRFALADRLTYAPSTKTFILSANPGKKVLFRDEEGSISVSAQEVHVSIDPETKKEQVRGIGSVQLSFSSDEINLLKKMFPGYE